MDSGWGFVQSGRSIINWDLFTNHNLFTTTNLGSSWASVVLVLSTFGFIFISFVRFIQNHPFLFLILYVTLWTWDFHMWIDIKYYTSLSHFRFASHWKANIHLSYQVKKNVINLMTMFFIIFSCQCFLSFHVTLWVALEFFLLSRID